MERTYRIRSGIEVYDVDASCAADALAAAEYEAGHDLQNPTAEIICDDGEWF